MKNKIINALQQNNKLTLGEIAYIVKRDKDIIEKELVIMINNGDLAFKDSYFSLPEIKIETMTIKNNNLDNLSSLLFEQLNKLTAVNANIDINQCKAVSNLARDVISIERMKLDEKQMNLDIANHLIDHQNSSLLPKLLSNGS